MLKTISNKDSLKFMRNLFIKIALLSIFIFVMSKVVLKVGSVILIMIFNITCSTKVVKNIDTNIEYNNFKLVKTCIFSKCNTLGCYYLSYCNEKDSDYCPTLYSKNLDNKLIYANKIKDAYIKDNMLYVILKKNTLYNIINENNNGIIFIKKNKSNEFILNYPYLNSEINEKMPNKLVILYE